jgi:ubiquinone/menaquinone biosynthesis C-methylase UbiE
VWPETITLGLAEAVPDGHVIPADLDLNGLTGAQRAAVSLGQQNVSWIGADGRSLPFHGAVFDVVLCHSMLETLETLGDLTPAIAELRRVTKRGGVVGAASVEYDGIIIAGEPTTGPRRFYDIRQRLWRASRITEPNRGHQLRGIFQVAGFGHLEAFADYISYGTPERVRVFASDRAAECRDRELQAAVTR